MKKWFMQLFGMHALGCGLVLSAFVAVMPMNIYFVEPAMHMASFGYSPYGSLAPCVLSTQPTVQSGDYYRTAHNGCGYAIKAWFENMRTGAKSKVYAIRNGDSKRMHIALTANRKDHYTIVVQTGPYSMLSGGVWTPLYGSWYWPTQSDPYFQACSQNPLKVRATLNGQQAPYDHGSWRLKSYTHNWVKPGGYACVKWSQGRHTKHRVKVTWNNGNESWPDGYEIDSRN